MLLYIYSIKAIPSIPLVTIIGNLINTYLSQNDIKAYLFIYFFINKLKQY